MTDAITGELEGGDGLPLAVSKDRKRIRQPRDIIPFSEVIRNAEQECFMVITLDGNNQVNSHHIVTVGLANQSQVHPRETFKWAVRHNAVSIMVVHNHPSGNLEPSEADLTATKRLVECGRILGIPVLDHIIVSGEGWVSLRDKHPGYFI